jgi:ABC-type polysaccharide/polyol phosphate export permease
VVELFHSGATGSALPGRSLAVSLVFTIVLLAAAAASHRRYDRLFVDLL